MTAHASDRSATLDSTTGDAPARPHALLVDDSGGAALVGRRLLDRLGYSVVVAADADAALACSAHTAFELLVIDPKLPGLDDLRVARELRARAAPQAVMLALGAPPTAERLNAWRAAGIDGRLDRPLDLAALQRELQRCRQARVAHRISAAEASAAGLDAAALFEEVDGDLQLLANLAELFAQQAEQRMAALCRAVDASDHAVLEHEAHALKSMIGLWQRGPAHAAAAALEQLGHQRSAHGATAERDRLRLSLQALQQQIAALLRSGAER